jgi:hypothetical protein
MRYFFFGFCFFALTSFAFGQKGNGKSVNAKHPSLNYKTIECVELDRMITSKKSPIIINCGNQEDIIGSIPIGEISKNSNWKSSLKQALIKSKIEKSFNKPVVVYCGCCSSDNCPNVEPVIKELISMGFRDVKGLYFFDGYGPDWKAKGYGKISKK